MIRSWRLGEAGSLPVGLRVARPVARRARPSPGRHQDDDSRPAHGSRWTAGGALAWHCALLVDSAGAGGRRRTVACRVIRLADVDDRHAIDEGEGFADAAAFRVAHERSWNSDLDVLRERLGDSSFAVTDDTAIMAERFRVEMIVAADGRPLEPRVSPADPADRAALDAFLADHNADVVARLGELVDARRHPALVAMAGESVAGVLTWILRGASMEVLTLHAAHQRDGVGTALISAARRVAEAAGVARLWLIRPTTTSMRSASTSAAGFRLARIHPGAVDRSARR
jgi:GNAT superfamily N-acetyltransferase